MEEKDVAENSPPRKLCLNCAYRENCRKRFSANVADGEVRCLDYEYDLSLRKKKD
jgi:hypothetical protein